MKIKQLRNKGCCIETIPVGKELEIYYNGDDPRMCYYTVKTSGFGVTSVYKDEVLLKES